MTIPAGSFCHRIVIESPTYATSSSGQKTVSSWTPIHVRQLPSTYRSVAGGETIRGRQIIATATAVFEIRYLQAMAVVNAETFRVRWMTGNPVAAQAPVLEILRVEDPDGLRESMMIQAKLVK